MPEPVGGHESRMLCKDYLAHSLRFVRELGNAIV